MGRCDERRSFYAAHLASIGGEDVVYCNPVTKFETFKEAQASAARWRRPLVIEFSNPRRADGRRANMQRRTLSASTGLEVAA